LGTFHFGVGLENLPPTVYSKLSQMPRLFVEQKSGNAKQIHQALTNSTRAFVEAFVARNRAEGLKKSPLSQTQKENFIAIGVPPEIVNLLRCDDGADYMLTLLNPKWAFPRMVAIDHQILEVSYSLGHQIFELDKPGVRERAAQVGEASRAKSDLNSCPLTELADGIDFSSITNSFNKRRLEYLNGNLEEDDDSSVIYRNKVWLKELVPFLKEGNNFVAVGAGHLIEPTGNLIDLLKAEGFSVTRITVPPEK
ncbi:MAG: TraB/GumN family protein, partial [Bdellovibrionales bacterium]